MNFKSDQEPRSWHRAARLLAPYVLPYRCRIGSAMVCLLIAVALRIVEPLPLQFILDRVLAEQLSGNAATNEPDAIAILTVCAIAVVLIACVRAIVEYLRVVTFAWIGNRVVTQLRRDVFQHLQSLSLSFHNRARSGDLTIRLVGDLNMIRDVAVTALLPMLASVLILTGMSAVMLWMHVWLGMLAISVFPLFWLSATKSSRKIHTAAKQQRSREGALAATANESLSSVKVVQALSLEHHFADKFGAHSQKSMREGVKTSRLSAALERKVDVMIAIASALVLWQGARYVMAGELTIGGLVVFLAYLKRGFKPLQDFAKYTGRLSKALAAADRVLEILETSPDVRDSPNAVDAPAFEGKIQFRNVTFGYRADTPIFKNVSFTIAPGEIVAIVGPSGVGKSTLLSLICRLHDPDGGTILVDGHDIRDWTVTSLRRQQSIVMQDNAVFATTVRENIAIADADATDAEVEAAALTASAHEFITALPDGYNTLLGERGANLSRGQTQRLAIARATIQSPPIFLVDEPTTGLDEQNERMVVEGILRASEGRTTLIVTHQMEIATHADKVFVLHQGEIIEIGSHDELMGKEGVYATMYRNQQQGRSKLEYALQQ
ncbi:ABC transporter ATP-binding protein [Stieleria varia]|uniref:Putative multidrug export ATP-binding/permease protein n=1 Tax=Stieleria varia TaxID=2528005 RepID=A0A5C6B3Y0_9BACT|nr:ABC transporter ATP-binding protein [Stieleria varia]TWU06191.1 putative multidrug export ATP-binding/permease protein [Stieleria varia]